MTFLKYALEFLFVFCFLSISWFLISSTNTITGITPSNALTTGKLFFHIKSELCFFLYLFYYEVLFNICCIVSSSATLEPNTTRNQNHNSTFTSHRPSLTKPTITATSSKASPGEHFSTICKFSRTIKCRFCNHGFHKGNILELNVVNTFCDKYNFWSSNY